MTPMQELKDYFQKDRADPETVPTFEQDVRDLADALGEDGFKVRTVLTFYFRTILFLLTFADMRGFMGANFGKVGRLAPKPYSSIARLGRMMKRPVFEEVYESLKKDAKSLKEFHGLNPKFFDKVVPGERPAGLRRLSDLLEKYEEKTL